MTALTARAAYRLWAPHYDAETAVSHLESETVATLRVETRGRSLLDVGCGTARRLRGVDAREAVGVDLTPEMLALSHPEEPYVAGAPQGELRDEGSAFRCALAAADALALPFAAESFDVVWCRLVLGHMADIRDAYAELSRVCVAGGAVVVSDIAAEAVIAGHRRTFHDESGTTHEVEHVVHSVDAHVAAARNAGLDLDRCETGVVGPSIRSFYADAGRLNAYSAQLGLPLVVALSFRKAAR